MPRRWVPGSQPSAGGARGRWGSGAGRRGLGLLALLLGFAPCGLAAARGGDNNRAALLRQAQPLVDKGVVALAAKDFAAATKILSSAYRSAPVPEVLLQLARLAHAEGRTVDAYDLYRRYLSDPTRIPNEAAVRETEAVLATTLPDTGSLAIIGPPSALVLIDERVVGVLPLPQPLLLAAGKHMLMLDLGGKRRDTPLQVQAGRLSEVRTGKSSGALLISLLPALLVIDEWPGLATDSLRPFTDAIERAAIGQQMGVMPAAVALRQGFELKQCMGTLPCQQQLAKRCNLDYVLRSRVVREAPPNTLAGAGRETLATPIPASLATTAAPGSTGVAATVGVSPAGAALTAGTRPTVAAQTPGTRPTGVAATAGTRPTGVAATSSTSPTGGAATAGTNLTGIAAPAATNPPGEGREKPAAPSPTANWTFELALLQVEVEEPASKVTLPCPACTAEQAATRYREALTDLLTRGLPRQVGTVQITSAPTAAAVALATRPLGKTPLHLSLWEGSYDLTLTYPGYQPTQQTLAIGAGKETSLSVPLLPTEQPVAVLPAPVPTTTPRSPTRLPRPVWRMAVGGALLGVSTVALSIGWGLLNINRNDKYCANSQAATAAIGCQYYWDTSASGTSTAGAGIALGIAGAVFMVIPGPRAN